MMDEEPRNRRLLLLLLAFYTPVWTTLAAQQILIVGLVLWSSDCVAAMSLSWLRGAHFILWFALFDYWLITRRGRSLTQYPWSLLVAVFLLNLPFAIGRLFGLFDKGSGCIASFLQSENAAQQLFIYEMILSVSSAVIAVGLMQAIRRRLKLIGHIK